VTKLRICAALLCWQDGDDCLWKTLDAAAPYCDLLLADGHFAGCANVGLPLVSDLEATIERYPGIRVEQREEWAGVTEKVDWILGADADWLLLLAADEELRNGHLLEQTLTDTDLDYWPIPFRNGGRIEVCPTKCIRPSRFIRSVAGVNAYEHADGHVYRVPPGTGDQDSPAVQWAVEAVNAGSVPYLDHHPDSRPEPRSGVRLQGVDIDSFPADAEPWPDWPYTGKP